MRRVPKNCELIDNQKMGGGIFCDINWKYGVLQYSKLGIYGDNIRGVEETS